MLETNIKASDVCKRINESQRFATNTNWDENEDIKEDSNFMDHAANQMLQLKKLQAQITYTKQGKMTWKYLCPNLRHSISQSNIQALTSQLIF